jgi:hypothetical protein
MEPGEFICRSAIHPKYRAHEIFDEVSLLSFMKRKKKYPYVASVTSLAVAGSEEGVHVAGRAAAALSNEREMRKLDDNPEYQVRAFHYLGYYSLLSSEVQLLASDYHRAELHWRPEDGSDAHFEIELHKVDFERPAEVDPEDVKSDKLAIVTMIADLLSGPTLCPVAAGDRELQLLQLTTLKRLEAGPIIIAIQ